jgi:indole-3-glycerol phosphate synthase
MTATYLDKILHWHRNRAAADSRSIDVLVDQALSCGPTRGFRSRIKSAQHLAVIAEIKRRSPSKGLLRDGLDPLWLAAQYEQGGASCLSVLTDSEHFGGSVEDLQAARGACGLPVLRKDFTVSVHDVCDARIMGADCVLLIAAALDDVLLRDCLATAHVVGIDALVEIHDEVELERALRLGANLVGVNQRDLITFQVDQERAVRMGKLFPDDVVAVAESGVRGREDALALHEAGYDAVLVGELLVTSPHPQEAVADLLVH